MTCGCPGSSSGRADCARGAPHPLSLLVQVEEDVGAVSFEVGIECGGERITLMFLVFASTLDSIAFKLAEWSWRAFVFSLIASNRDAFWVA